MLFFKKKDLRTTQITAPSFELLRGWFGFFNSKNKALQVNTFYACLKLLSNFVATCPVNIINKNNRPINQDLQYLLKIKPNANQSAFDFWRLVVFNYLLFGNSYILLRKDSRNNMISLQCLNSEHCEPYYTNGGLIEFRYNGIDTFNHGEVIHLRNLSLDGLKGLSSLDLLINSFNVAGKLNKLLEQDALPPILKTPEELLQDNQIADLASDIKKKINDKPLILPKDFELILNKEKGAFYNKFAELKKFTDEEIARFFNIPLGIIGLDGASQPNVLDTQNRLLLQNAINPILRNIEQSFEIALFDRKDLLNGYRVKFNRNALLLQTDANSRADFYKKMLDLGIYDTDKIKQLEDIA